MRIVFSVFIGLIVALGIFIGMQQMTSTSNIKQEKPSEHHHLVYLRDKKETMINEKKRVIPKKPEPQKPKKVELLQPKMKVDVEKTVKLQTINPNIDLSSISSLSGAKINVDVGLIDANTLMTVSRSYPKYPRRAKFQKKEGFVQLQFKIDQKGYVHAPIVISSNPKGFFEESALQAIKRWRFKAKGGVDSFIDAMITFNYRLSQ